MVFYVFPFEKINKGSRVILYGANSVGKSFYNQINETNYCDVVLWVDKNTSEASIKLPTEIMEVNDNDYDHIIIAESLKTTVKDIKEYLLTQEIPESKIIDVIHTYKASSTGIVSNLNLDSFLYEEGAVEKALIEYFYESDSDLDYFSPFVEEIIQITISRNDIYRDSIVSSIENKTLDIINESILSIESKVLLLRLIFEARCFSGKLMRKLVRLCTQIKENPQLKYWLIFDLSFMWINHRDILYDDFWTEKKKLNEDYARELNLVWKPPIRKTDGKQRICVLVNVLDVRGITLYASQIVRAVKNKGYSISVINLAPKRNDSAMGIMKPFFSVNSIKTTSREELLSLYPEDIDLHYIFNDMMKNRQQDILDRICQIDPCCILDFSDEQAPVSYYYSQNYPVIYFPVRKQGYSSSFFHKYVVWQNNEDVEVYPPIKHEQVLRLPMYRERIEPLRKYNRAEYGISENDIVIITVGSRLIDEISNELSGQMCDFISECVNVKWVLVGCTELPYISNNYRELEGNKIVYIEYENDIPGLFKVCDVYLNPDRIGGGSTVSWAMQQGLAVVSPLTASDGLCYIGKDNALPKETDLVPYIKSLLINKELLKSEKEKYRAIAAEWDLNSFITKLIYEIQDISLK